MMYMIVEGAFLLSPIGATFGIRTSILQGRKEKEKHGGGVTNVSVNTLKFLCRDPQGWDDLPVSVPCAKWRRGGTRVL